MNFSLLARAIFALQNVYSSQYGLKIVCGVLLLVDLFSATQNSAIGFANSLEIHYTTSISGWLYVN